MTLACQPKTVNQPVIHQCYNAALPLRLSEGKKTDDIEEFEALERLTHQ